MLVYHGAAIGNLLRESFGDVELYVTDTPERAVRYANAQATWEVNPAMDQDLANGAAVLEIEVSESPSWSYRSENHLSLEQCEATVREYAIKRIYVRFGTGNVSYGSNKRANGFIGYRSPEQVREFFWMHGIEIVEVERD
jgi:hypothetical protein